MHIKMYYFLSIRPSICTFEKWKWTRAAAAVYAVPLINFGFVLLLLVVQPFVGITMPSSWSEGNKTKYRRITYKKLSHWLVIEQIRNTHTRALIFEEKIRMENEKETPAKWMSEILVFVNAKSLENILNTIERKYE